MLDDARAALLAVLERAHNDQDESVRVQAVTAVAAWPSRHEWKVICAQSPVVTCAGGSI